MLRSSRIKNAILAAKGEPVAVGGNADQQAIRKLRRAGVPIKTYSKVGYAYDPGNLFPGMKGRQQAALINCLRQAAGAHVSVDDIAECVWGVADNWPDTYRTTLHMLVHRMRKKGWPIASGFGGKGYRYAPELVQPQTGGPELAEQGGNARESDDHDQHHARNLLNGRRQQRDDGGAGPPDEPEDQQE